MTTPAARTNAETTTPSPEPPARTRAELEAALRGMDRFYHIHHPFHIAMNEGGLEPAAVRGWVANRFYYQIQIPRKDAAILSNCPDREIRRAWIQRILDHDGTRGDEGGIEAWLRLGEAVGLTREEVLDLRHVLPGVRFAVDAYVQFARTAPWQEAIASSLTELFAPTIHQKRLESWPVLYPWIDAEGYGYFRRRLAEARRDVEHGLDFTLGHFVTRAQQDRVIEVLTLKLEILWSMLDAMWVAYVDRQMPPMVRARVPG
jgi:pyrroloquinoline-quinone synthase